jgi:hypothetical protein
MRAIAIVLVLCGLALADKDKAKLSAADQKKYKELLDKGRQLEDKKKYADAMAAFEQALAIAKDDATVLAEMGWTAYLSGDYAKAEKYTRDALANVSTPNVRGAALYNLGLIQEKKGDRAGAIASYSASLKERSNATVRAALAKLDPAAAAQLDPFKPQAMAGPFKSVDEFCKGTKKPDNRDPDDWECQCAVEANVKQPTAAKPYEAFEVVAQRCYVSHTVNAEASYFVAVKVGGSWYVGPFVDTRASRHCNNDASNPRIELDGGRASAWVDETGECWGNDKDWKWTEKELVVVGVGPSGKPSATPTIVMTRKEIQSDQMSGAHEKTVVDIALELVWGKDNALVVKGKATGADASVLGKHALAFP